MVNCGLIIPSLNISNVVFPFLLDTGASITSLSNYFARILNIDYNDENNLRKDRPVSGIGGTMDAYLVEKASLIFFTQDNNALVLNFNNWNFRITKVEHTDEEMRERMINTIPNIIGRDIFLQSGIQFTYSNNEVLLAIDM